jgi:predicted AlkP superfamily pyrophosphatase or phosphodiesterase
MHNSILKNFLLICCVIVSQNAFCFNNHPPKLTIVIVIDQCAYHYINKLYKHFKHGIRYLLDHGVVYTNAYMPHGLPSTATGHAALSTGTYAKDHGFVGNAFFDSTGKKIACDDDNRPESYVFMPTEDAALYNYGKSARQLMVDSLSDQCVLQSQPESIFRAFSISGKSRSAIATAGRLGKAIWFDDQSGLFTSSKAYFDQLPAWLTDWNDHNVPFYTTDFEWKKMYPKSPSAYNFFNTDDYTYSRLGKTLIDRPMSFPDKDNPTKPYFLFEKTPRANQMLLDTAQECMRHHVKKKSKDRLLLWVCLSPLDKVGHEYGPNSLEAIDMLYHIDKQLEKFIHNAIRLVGKYNVAFVMTADHGVMPIPGILNKNGFDMALRVDSKDLVQDLNDYIKKYYALSNGIANYKGQQLFFNYSVLDSLDKDEQDNLKLNIQERMQGYPYIKKVWMRDELNAHLTAPGTLEDNIKNQLFPSRSGDIIVQHYPYVLCSHWQEGASHKSPYNYDTHVPLVFFHRGKWEKRQVRQRVTALQVANSIAELLNVPKPSASTQEILPELFDPEYQ